MENNIIKHTLLKSTFLHLLPGILGGICFFILSPIVNANGFPTIMALIISGIIILIPFELGFLIYQKKVTGQNLFNGVIKYFKTIPVWQYFFTHPIDCYNCWYLFKLLGFTSTFLMTFFKWMPSDSILTMGLDSSLTKSKLLFTYLLFLPFLVFVLPTIEEFYFRGYLLPRMPIKLKGWTEITHSALFALYHTWTPWMFVVRTFGVLPLIFLVKRKKKICFLVLEPTAF
ncbi:MAG: CPBP family intramembrane metalloprotease [Bacteroidetes bacterium]|nr:CPBP family intramembrane metalloprotease [Bacteroidota bacterium]